MPKAKTSTGIGRPPKGDAKRVKRVNVSFSESEYKNVEKARRAINEDVSMTAFVRRCALLMAAELL